MARCSAPASTGEFLLRDSRRARLYALAGALPSPLRRLATTGGQSYSPLYPEKGGSTCNPSPRSIPRRRQRRRRHHGPLRAVPCRSQSSAPSATVRPSGSAPAAAARSPSAGGGGERQRRLRRPTARTAPPRAALPRPTPGEPPLPSFHGRRRGRRSPATSSSASSRSRARSRADRGDARPAPRLSALDHRRDRDCHPPLPGRACSGAARADPDRPLAPRRARPVPAAARRDALGDRDRRRDDRRRRRPGGRVRRSGRGGDRR